MYLQEEKTAYKRLVRVLTKEVTLDKIEKSLLKLGGKIVYRYKHIPYLALELPAEQCQVMMASEIGFGLMEDGQVSTQVQKVPWGIEKIGAAKAHSSFRNKGSGVKIGVIDSGIAVRHPDIKVYGGVSFVDKLSYADDNGHGTHVAGIIAALDNSFGVIGVAPAAQLYAVKVLDAKGSGCYSDVAAGIEWCIEHKMDIISLSLGGTVDSSLLKAAVTKAWRKGILIVAAAGNTGNTNGTGDNVIYPAKYREVIAVAAVDSKNKRAEFSATGPDVELAAPGVGISSTYLGGGYLFLNGTSMAAPHVSGCAALVKAANPKLTNQQIRAILTSSAQNLGSPGRDKLYGYGLVSVGNALKKATMK